MSQLQSVSAATEPAPTVRSSKRKRAQINYYESTSDVEDVDSQVATKDIEECSPAKKRKERPGRPLPKRKIFPFLQLPAEIRILIYEYALHDPYGIYLEATTVKYRRTVMRVDPNSKQSFDEHQELKGAHARPLVPSLLAVNQQVYNEGRDILYGNNFKLGDPLTLHSFIVNIGARAASQLRRITLSAWGGWGGMHKAYNHASFAVLVSATNLEEVTIDGWLCCRNVPKWIARQIYRDAFPWLEAVGVAKGTPDAAVNIIDVSPKNFIGRGFRRREQSDPIKDLHDMREELRRLLGARMKKIPSSSGKKKKTQKS